jgi:hypothetical protein
MFSTNVVQDSNCFLWISKRWDPLGLSRVTRISCDRPFIVNHKDWDTAPAEAPNDTQPLVIAADHDGTWPGCISTVI